MRSEGENRALTEDVHHRIRDAIMSAELRPSERLVESELASRLGVSRTPVREALLRLEQEGQVERSRGWIVREYRPAEVRARLECRLALEGFAARLAAARRPDDFPAELSALAESLYEPGLPRVEYNARNENLHKRVVEASGNPALLELHGQTKMHYWDLSVPVVFTESEERSVARQHRALVEAIAARDAPAAERVAREHVQLTMDIVLKEIELHVRGMRG